MSNSSNSTGRNQEIPQGDISEGQIGTHNLEANKKQRLVGLDVFRAIAAFAVVILHADEGISSQPAGWAGILNFSGFAVPFFLAAAFYLLLRKVCSEQKPIAWKPKLSRLLIPYGVWSLIYLGQNILRLIAKHQPEKLQGLANNFLGLIFLGQSAFHLYFIPLLVTGLLLVWAIKPLLRKRFSLLTQMGFVAASLIVYQSYRLFMVSPTAESSHAETVALTVAGYAARCLPYIAIAFLLNHATVRDRLLKLNGKDALLLLLAFGVINIVHAPLLLRSLHELLVGYSAFLLALALSSLLRDNRVVTSLGYCSFGIYLMQLLWLDLCWSVLKRFDLGSAPSTPMLLLVAALGFGLSWGMTALLMKPKGLSKILFG